MYVISTEALLYAINDRCEFIMSMHDFKTCHLAEFVLAISKVRVLANQGAVFVHS